MFTQTPKEEESKCYTISVAQGETGLVGRKQRAEHVSLVVETSLTWRNALRFGGEWELMGGTSEERAQAISQYDASIATSVRVTRELRGWRGQLREVKTPV